MSYFAIQTVYDVAVRNFAVGDLEATNSRSNDVVVDFPKIKAVIDDSCLLALHAR